MFVNKKIKDARLEKKYTQKKLAEELCKFGRKTSNTAIANWESGLNSPDIDTLSLICQILDKDINYFFSDQEKNSKSFEINDLTTDEIKELTNYKDFIKSKRKDNKKDV